MPIHPSAKLHPMSIVDPDAEIGPGAVIEAAAEVERGAKVGQDTIIRSGCHVHEHTDIGAGCDVAASHVGYNAKLGDSVKLDSKSSVGNAAQIDDGTYLEPGARVGTRSNVGKRTRLGPDTHVHPFTTVGADVTTGKNVHIGHEVTIGDETTLDDDARVGRGAEIGKRTRVGENARIGMEGPAGMARATTVGDDCTLGHEARMAGQSHMGDGCTLEANARLKIDSVMEKGSTVCAGSHIEPGVVVGEGETIPPSTLVARNGTRNVLPVDIDDYKFRDNEDDREARVHQMNTRYTGEIAADTQPAERSSGQPLTETQMLLEMEIRLQVAARHNEVRIEDDNWWSSRPKDEDRTQAERQTVIRIPRAALEAQGREATAQNLGLLAEMTTHGRLSNEGAPPHLRTGDPEIDDSIIGYIAGAAGDLTRQFALTGRFEPSQNEVPPEKREPLFMDLEIFDEIIAERYGKRLTEKDIYREAKTIERRHFDTATSDEAREAWQRISEKHPPQSPEPPARLAANRDSSSTMEHVHPADPRGELPETTQLPTTPPTPPPAVMGAADRTSRSGQDERSR